MNVEKLKSVVPYQSFVCVTIPFGQLKIVSQH